MVIMEKELNKNCLSCGLLLTQMKKTNSDSYRQYDLILQILMELERKGVVELFAGDCPLEDIDTVLGAEQQYTVCQYMRCRSCGAIYFIGSCIHGSPVYRKVENLQAENLDNKLWGRYGTYFSEVQSDFQLSKNDVQQKQTCCLGNKKDDKLK